MQSHTPPELELQEMIYQRLSFEISKGTMEHMARWSYFIIQSLRAFRRAVLFSLFAWRLVGLLSLRLFVCWFDREGFLRTFRELVLGPLGLHFGRSEGPLGTILGSLGTSWDPF